MGQKRKYTMSEKALEQRRAAAQLSTGPRTEAGKAVSCKNAWKTGEFSAVHKAQFATGLGYVPFHMGRPCKTTCPKHPDNDPTYPCQFVEEGVVVAGGDCLDKAAYVQAFDALMAAMQDGELGQMHGLLASQLSGAVQLLSDMRDSIHENGFVTPVYSIDKDGNVVLDPRNQEPMIMQFKPNPIVSQYIKLLDSLGIDFAALMATPKAQQAVQDNEDGKQAAQELLGQVLGAAALQAGRTIDGSAELLND